MIVWDLIGAHGRAGGLSPPRHLRATWGECFHLFLFRVLSCSQHHPGCVDTGQYLRRSTCDYRCAPQDLCTGEILPMTKRAPEGNPTAALRLIDGGITCNNPADVAVHEARMLFGKERRLVVCSVGTGQGVAAEASQSSYLPSWLQNLVNATGDVAQTDATVRRATRVLFDCVCSTACVERCWGRQTVRDLQPGVLSVRIPLLCSPPVVFFPCFEHAGAPPAPPGRPVLPPRAHERRLQARVLRRISADDGGKAAPLCVLLCIASSPPPACGACGAAGRYTALLQVTWTLGREAPANVGLRLLCALILNARLCASRGVDPFPAPPTSRSVSLDDARDTALRALTDGAEARVLRCITACIFCSCQPRLAPPAASTPDAFPVRVYWTLRCPIPTRRRAGRDQSTTRTHARRADPRLCPLPPRVRSVRVVSVQAFMDTPAARALVAKLAVAVLPPKTPAAAGASAGLAAAGAPPQGAPSAAAGLQ